MLTCPEKLVFAFYGWIIPVSLLLHPFDPCNVFLREVSALLDRRDICPDPASDLKILRFMHERVGSVYFLVIPLTPGISLPFFSYGGTALLMQLFEVGLILSVSRQNDNNFLYQKSVS